MTAREAGKHKHDGDGGGQERQELQSERTLSRRGRFMIVGAIVAAGIIDGVARVHLNLPSWDESDPRIGNKDLRFSEEPEHIQTLHTLSQMRAPTAPRAIFLESSRAAARVEEEREETSGSSGDTLLAANRDAQMQKSAKKEMLMQHELGGECEEHWNCMSWLVCTEGVCSPCERSEECQERHGSESICFEHILLDEQLIEFKNLNYNVCKHKPLMLPFVDWVCMCLCVCVCGGGVCIYFF